VPAVLRMRLRAVPLDGVVGGVLDWLHVESGIVMLCSQSLCSPVSVCIAGGIVVHVELPVRAHQDCFVKA
jgi:hypothetical protein